ncbi:hypothetical protein ACA910_021751 [Epithemia clementina (nom. ined.)]
MELLRDTVFSEKFELYNREPLLHIGRWGITGTISLNPLFVLQFVLTNTITQMLCALAAVIAYYGIVQLEARKQQRRGSIQSVLLGYGFILPLLLYTPYWLIQTLDIRNCLLLMNMVGSPSLAIMRLNETLFARELPYFARTNVGFFALYFAVPIVLDHDNYKPTYSTMRQFLQKLGKVGSLFVQAMFFLSLLSAFDYRIFPSRPFSTWIDFLYWGNLANNFMAASVVSVTLDLGCTFGEVILTALTGLQFVNSHDYPISAATSVSNFWGQRWNRLVSTSLKRGVYGPMRRILPRAPAAILTFLMSGFAHEYMLFVLCAARGPEVVANNLARQPYQHQLGHQFAFFLWNGLLLVFEECWRGHWSQKIVKQCVPKQIRTILIMLLVLPVTHLFTDEYDECGIFRDIETIFPQIRLVPNSTPLLSHPILDDIFVQGQNWSRNWFDGASSLMEEEEDDPSSTWDAIINESTSGVIDAAATIELVKS